MMARKTLIPGPTAPGGEALKRPADTQNPLKTGCSALFQCVSNALSVPANDFNHWLGQGIKRWLVVCGALATALPVSLAQADGGLVFQPYWTYRTEAPVVD